MAKRLSHMKLDNLPIGMTDWPTIPVVVHPVESGAAAMRTRQIGEIKLRFVEYSGAYVADHWCHKGHIDFVVPGQLVIEHRDGTAFTLQAGTSYHAADDDGSPHGVRPENGATLFIAD